MRGTPLVVGASTPKLPEEGERKQPGHVEGGHNRGEHSHAPKKRRAVGRRKGLPKNLVLGEESGQRRNATDSEPPCRKRPVRPRHPPSQPSHLEDILLLVHSVN